MAAGGPLETSATFSEERIKTYGFAVSKGLVMGDLTLERDRMGALWHDWPLSEGGDRRFSMVLGLEAKGDLFRLLLVMEPEVAACLSRLLREKGLGPLEVEAPVALLFFQGPHYGDRHGIADTALRALEDHGLAPLASACSQSCIYLVLPDAEAEEGESALSAVFLIPREHTSKRRRGA